MQTFVSVVVFCSKSFMKCGLLMLLNVVLCPCRKTLLVTRILSVIWTLVLQLWDQGTYGRFSSLWTTAKVSVAGEMCLYWWMIENKTVSAFYISVIRSKVIFILLLLHNCKLFCRGTGGKFDEPEAADGFHRGWGAADLLWHLRCCFSPAPAQDTNHPQRP